MSTRIFFVALSLLLSLRAHAQMAGEEAGLFESPAKSEALLELHQLFTRDGKNTENLQATFQQTRTITMLSRPLISSGQFYFFPGKGLCWDTSKPFRSTTLITRREIITSNSRGEKTLIPQHKVPQLASLMQTMDNLFSGSPDGLQNEFDVFMQKHDGNGWALGLVPKKKTFRKMISRIRIEGLGRHVNSFTLEEASGDRAHITFAHHQPLVSSIPKEWYAALDLQP